MGEKLKIQLENDIVGFAGCGVEVPFECNNEFWNGIIGSEAEFPNGVMAVLFQPILKANRKELEAIRFMPIDSTRHLAGKKGESIIVKGKYNPPELVGEFGKFF